MKAKVPGKRAALGAVYALLGPEERATVVALRRDFNELLAMLLELQKLKYHHPDSDRREYCAGCGNSPYNEPAHKPDCIVPRLSALLKRVSPWAR